MRRRGQPGHPERGAHSIVTDLAAAGYAVTQKGSAADFVMADGE
jgi:hypothetical protein